MLYIFHKTKERKIKDVASKFPNDKIKVDSLEVFFVASSRELTHILANQLFNVKIYSGFDRMSRKVTMT
jgi:hypothetical protein